LTGLPWNSYAQELAVLLTLTGWHSTVTFELLLDLISEHDALGHDPTIFSCKLVHWSEHSLSLGIVAVGVQLECPENSGHSAEQSTVLVTFVHKVPVAVGPKESLTPLTEISLASRGS